MPNNFLNQMAQQAAANTDAALADRELELIAGTSVDFDALRVQMSDKATFDQLIAGVQQQTTQLEKAAALRSNVRALGAKGLSVAKQIVSFLV